MLPRVCRVTESIQSVPVTEQRRDLKQTQLSFIPEHDASCAADKHLKSALVRTLRMNPYSNSAIGGGVCLCV